MQLGYKANGWFEDTIIDQKSKLYLILENLVGHTETFSFIRYEIIQISFVGTFNTNFTISITKVKGK